MRQYLDLLRQIMDQGVVVQTGAYLPEARRRPTARRLHGAQIQFDLTAGFPAITVKPLWWKAVVAELIWFFRGDGNIAYLREQGVSSIWEPWVKKNPDGTDDGDLGPVYGVQFRRWPCVEAVKPKLFTPSPPPQPPFFDAVEPDSANDTLNLVGRIYSANDAESGQFRVIKANDCTSDGRRLHDIQFLATGYIQHGVDKQCIENGRVKDRYAISVAGVGRLGEPGDYTYGIKKIWSHMLDRCYNPACKEYYYYGARGITVDGPWHVFSTFYNDVRELEGWHLKLTDPENYQLDKDFFGGGCYSKETCVWLHVVQQKVYRSNSVPFRAMSPDGTEYKAVSASQFAHTFDLERSKISACLRGERPSHKGWTFTPLDDPGIIYREREVDQIAGVRDGIRAVVADPFDRARRRLIVTLWNPAQIEAMALPPCHTIHMYDMLPPDGDQVLADGGDDYAATGLDPRWTLNLQLFARSIDAVKGLPFNIASYALMCHVMAAVTGTKPGTLTITFNDVHIYDNQEAEVAEQLARTPYPPSTLRIADGVFAPGGIAPDLTVAQAHLLTTSLFRLEGYRHHGKLSDRSEVAV